MAETNIGPYKASRVRQDPSLVDELGLIAAIPVEAVLRHSSHPLPSFNGPIQSSTLSYGYASDRAVTGRMVIVPGEAHPD